MISSGSPNSQDDHVVVPPICHCCDSMDPCKAKKSFRNKSWKLEAGSSVGTGFGGVVIEVCFSLTKSFLTLFWNRK